MTLTTFRSFAAQAHFDPKGERKELGQETLGEIWVLKNVTNAFEVTETNRAALLLIAKHQLSHKLKNEPRLISAARLLQ